jgi:ATP-binding cassette subfamily F protein uup
METLDVLEEMLVEYQGTVLLISHDRDFLDRLVAGTVVPEGKGRWTEYAGGYSDMLSQRGADLTREAPKKEKKESPGPAKEDSASSKRRMTFKDKHALETLPRLIAEMQAKVKALTAKLEDPQLYARDRAAFEATSGEIAQLQRNIEMAEERWLALELEREQLGG